VGGRRPDWLVLGAPRSGTTTLSTFLDEHPGAYLAPGKELQFLDRDDYDESEVDRYLRHFAGGRPDQRVGEASPRYLYVAEVPGRVAAICPDARLAAILRDPVDRAYSHYWWRRLWKAEPRTFEEAVRDEQSGRLVSGAEYLWGGCYADHLEAWEARFPTEQLCVLLFDDLRADPLGTFQTLCRHFGIDDSFEPPSMGQQINTTHDLRWPRLWKATLRWRERRRLGIGSQQVAPPSVAARVAEWVDGRNARPFKPPKLDEALRAELDEWFAAPTDRLRARLGRDLTWGRRR
jgi:hypothetical protein